MIYKVLHYLFLTTDLTSSPITLSLVTLQSCWPCFSITPSTLPSQGLGVCKFSTQSILPCRYVHGVIPYSLLVSAHTYQRGFLYSKTEPTQPSLSIHLQLSSQQLHLTYLFIVSCPQNESSIILLGSLLIPNT